MCSEKVNSSSLFDIRLLRDRRAYSVNHNRHRIGLRHVRDRRA
jgi:hypothetical protein